MFEIDEVPMLEAMRKKKPVKHINCKICKKLFICKYKSAKFCSKKCYGEWRSVNIVGERNNRWKGGVSERTSESRKLMEKRKKEIAKCEKCGNLNGPFHAHHILHRATHPELQADPNNIKILCTVCHALEHPNCANALSYPRKRDGITINCSYCNKEVYLIKSLSQITKHCSQKCRKLDSIYKLSKFLTNDQIKELLQSEEMKSKYCGYLKVLSIRYKIGIMTLWRILDKGQQQFNSFYEDF